MGEDCALGAPTELESAPRLETPPQPACRLTLRVLDAGVVLHAARAAVQELVDLLQSGAPLASELPAILLARGSSSSGQLL